MSRVAAVLLCAAAAVAVGVCAQPDGGTVQMSVLYSGGKWSVVSGINQQQGVAWGSFADTLNTTGWGVLNIETNSAFADAQQMYAAGYLESALTHARIYESALNMRATFFGSTTANPPSALAQWFAQNEQWLNAQVKANPTDRNWQHIGLIKAQFDGEVDGYMASAGAGQALARLDLQVVNGVGDLLDLLNVIEPQRMREWTSLSKKDFDLMVYRRSLCSALVKVTGDYSELFAGHSAWFTYSAMNRIYKYYTFAVSTAPAAQSMGFSSYPGMLESLDDFYTMSSGLTMIQTTISNFNQSLYSAVTPHSLLAWYRVRLANWLSTTGAEWYANFAPYNSGTYNNEYMVVNYNVFTPGQPLRPGTLWVIEQMPTLCVGDDLTDILAEGYWPSYNVPYFQSIYNLSGWAAAAEQYGTDYTWELAPRAQIFRRDQGTVQDLPSFQALMRYNDYTADPYSAGDPMKAICSRGDLASPPNFGGCYDTKVTDSKLAPALAAFALNGPTQSHNLPAFAWTAANSGMASHLGEPAVYDFDFQPMTPATFGPNGRGRNVQHQQLQRRAHNHKRH